MSPTRFFNFFPVPGPVNLEALPSDFSTPLGISIILFGAIALFSLTVNFYCWIRKYIHNPEARARLRQKLLRQNRGRVHTVEHNDSFVEMNSMYTGSLDSNGSGDDGYNTNSDKTVYHDSKKSRKRSKKKKSKKVKSLEATNTPTTSNSDLMLDEEVGI